jgi:hypothetical protein
MKDYLQLSMTNTEISRQQIELGMSQITGKLFILLPNELEIVEKLRMRTERCVSTP